MVARGSWPVSPSRGKGHGQSGQLKRASASNTEISDPGRGLSVPVCPLSPVPGAAKLRDEWDAKDDTPRSARGGDRQSNATSPIGQLLRHRCTDSALHAGRQA